MAARNTLLNFYSKFNASGDCWEWTASKDKCGYGRVGGFSKLLGKTGKLQGAHQVSYFLCIGNLIPGMDIDHLCSNPGCVNPAHLEQVTHKVNVMRGKGACATNKRKTHCPAGHKYVEGSYYSYKEGWRQCNECRWKRSREYYYKNK